MCILSTYLCTIHRGNFVNSDDLHRAWDKALANGWQPYQEGSPDALRHAR